MSRAPSLSDAEAMAAVEQAADLLFYRHGVVGVSMAQIRDVSGVSLRRLYALCPSKADLISVWLRHRHKVWLDEYSGAVDARIADGVPPNEAIFDAVASWMTDTDFRGCGFINTHAESSELTNEHRRIIQDHKRAVGQYLSTIVPQGEAMAVLVDGAIVQAAIFSNTTPIELAKRAAKALCNQEQTT